MVTACIRNELLSIHFIMNCSGDYIVVKTQLSILSEIGGNLVGFFKTFRIFKLNATTESFS